MDDSLFGQEADAKSAYLVAMKNHEKLWAEKSRIRWMKEGDRNFKFFHLYTKIKRAKNTTRRVKKIDGSIISDIDNIACYMSKFYEDFHKGVPVTNRLDLLDAIPRLIDEVDLLSQDSIPGPNEIKRTMWDLDPESSLGPDGYPGYFFRCCWNIISRDFERAVGDFFTSRSMPPGMNNNLLVLIPKINGATSLNKFRPLCMGNFFCKIISKILATRLSFLLPRLISEEQGAFQKGKHIHNNIALASELANIMHSTTRGGGLRAKIDIQKAFDTAQLATSELNGGFVKVTPFLQYYLLLLKKFSAEQLCQKLEEFYQKVPGVLRADSELGKKLAIHGYNIFFKETGYCGNNGNPRM
ncbi:uncharacterized protein LOC122066036 [Macadamia integrifolia]|uniref:uncharacterized protein LOC122066036 n=1 Tax=Macadamia integrifolia TaxID=60698 RepID=UPI001C4FC7E9|nr:uncharacterized protein LOC122066036 [Macadamia integrifolia]